MILNGIYFDESPGKGRGMFTAHNVPADTVIETAPVVVMTKEERSLLDKTRLHDYIFEWNPGEQKMCCMAQGYISVYNHSYASNCEYFMDYDANTIEIRTVRDINAGEELTINYNGDWNDESTVWFDMD